VSSLYRKWRSQSFDDLYGQPHVVRTLRNAVAQHRVAHAYLFTGPRGTGKTSTARILAKAVNCLDSQDGNPCNRCEMCLAANEGRALDVIEIDAASNTSVDNVRDLRERVAYAAGEGR
jgi:DNA polymerase-3 subunit gamma/tau